MIRTLVVDDDFQVARIHAASVERVPGFTCIGQAHTAAEAAETVTATRPDLMILDIYLPDTDGLTLLRELAAQGDAPDTIVITAARDLATVRSAMSLGAVYYLVKPFGFPALAQQLLAYRRWHEQLTSEVGAQADQATVDSLFNLLRPAATGPAGDDLPVTMAKVLQAVTSNETPLGATDVARALGISRPTAQRYLSELERRKLLRLELSYGAAGRPVHRYRAGP
ncbi:Response regulator of citrate/malate metabolism [Nakamurella panacisegetis]|uniref:Transcriptional regulatory protein n=1 Tax=Nakamurella panacisegetis TaxID=1090615 RepID=A0A1H0S8I2_9ACTN|nr:response regulator [Nakamurella panacisegetis]SDP37977.1 Response regulator of citrate/malate metabolism [Nakamurella panacisegetis]